MGRKYFFCIKKYTNTSPLWVFFIKTCIFNKITNVADPGSGAFLTPKSGMGKKSGSGSGMNNPDHISENLETIFWVKILKLFDADPGWETYGSGINFPDPQR